MGKGAVFLIFVAAVHVLLSPTPAPAEKLCQANRVKVKKNGVGKAVLKVAAVCPKGFIEVLDLSALSAKGERGEKGEKGDPGVSATDPLPSGDTFTGVIGGDFQQDGVNLGDWRVLVSLPIQAPAPIGESNIIVKNNEKVSDDCLGNTCLSTREISKPDVCAGSAQMPSAPPGTLCIYPVSSVNARSIHAFPVPVGGDVATRGFGVGWSVIGAGDTFFNGVWAYTAP